VIRSIAEDVAKGKLDPADIDESMVNGRFWTAEDGDPDLILRTSGEERISNFMLWQAAYSELIFTPILWPDFTRADLMAALEKFAARERRYGKVNSNELIHH
jgi:undecaprenyl diphosphate synthase